jgi:hypothetical protein
VLEVYPRATETTILDTEILQFLDEIVNAPSPLVALEFDIIGGPMRRDFSLEFHGGPNNDLLLDQDAVRGMVFAYTLAAIETAPLWGSWAHGFVGNGIIHIGFLSQRGGTVNS